MQTSPPAEPGDAIASARKGRVSRKLVWQFIAVFSVLAITAVVIAFHGKDPIAERQAAEEEKRRQQQAGQAAGKPADLAKILLAQTEAGKADREAKPKQEEANQAAGKASSAPTADPQPEALGNLTHTLTTENYRHRRNAASAVDLPIYLDDRDPHAGGKTAERSAREKPPLASDPDLMESKQRPERTQLDALYKALYSGKPGEGGAAYRSSSNDEWLRGVQHAGGENAPLFAQPALYPEYTLRRGAIIPAVTVRGLNSDLPGQLTVQVTQDIYDSATGQNLLIPKGTQLVGSYNADIGENQDRLFAAFQQIVFRKGATVNLPGMPASDLAGYSGVPGERNSHFWRIFGSSFLVAGIARLLTPREQRNNTVVINAGSGLSDDAGQVLVETTRRILDRNQNIRPTVTVGHGEKINVEVTRDLVLPPEITGTGREANP